MGNNINLPNILSNLGANEIKFNNHIEVDFEDNTTYIFEVAYALDKGFYLKCENEADVKDLLLNNYNLDIFYLKGNPKRMPSKVKNIVVYGMVLQAMFDFSLMGTLLRYDSCLLYTSDAADEL